MSTAVGEHRRVAEHEAAHAAAAILLGFEPEWVAVHLDDPTAPGHIEVPADGLDGDGWRDVALFVLAGRAYDPGHMPAWPPQSESKSTDERILAAIAEGQSWQRDDWDRAVGDTWRLTATDEFKRLHLAIAEFLDRGHNLDGRLLHRAKAIAEGTDMEHITFKAAVTPTTRTDRGVFSAVISAASIDREKDIVDPNAMVRALHKWNRPIPLAWNHSTAPEDIIGTVDPQSARAVDGEVQVDGQVDLESKRGSEAWRSFKTRSIGFSFGYLSLQATKRRGGGRHHTELDVFEITATPTPMNNDTRVLDWKALDDETSRPPSHAELEARLLQEGIIARPTGLESYASEGVDPSAVGAGQNGDHRREKSTGDAHPRQVERDQWLERFELTDTAEPETKAVEPDPIRIVEFPA